MRVLVISVQLILVLLQLTIVKCGTYGTSINKKNNLAYPPSYTFYLDNGIARINTPKQVHRRQHYGHSYPPYDSENDYVQNRMKSLMDDALEEAQNLFSVASNLFSWKWVPFVFLVLSLIPTQHHILKRDITEEISSNWNVESKIQDFEQIFHTVYNSEECMAKIICALERELRQLSNNSAIWRLILQLFPEFGNNFKSNFQVTNELGMTNCNKRKCPEMTNLLKKISNLEEEMLRINDI